MQHEFQNAYAVSVLTQTRHNVAIPFGQFAVVSESPDYCQFTDATLPNPCRHVVRMSISRRIAEYHAVRLNRENSDDYDVQYVVLPRERVVNERAPMPKPDFGDDYVPF